MSETKVKEIDLLEYLQVGRFLLPPLTIESIRPGPRREQRRPDAVIETHLARDGGRRFKFNVEAKSKSTPATIKMAVAQARAYATEDENPLILVPYLSPERLEELEAEQVSGVDACGNGIIVVPDQLYVLRTGQPNLFKESRPLNNPYRGRSSLVARVLLEQRRWDSLSEVLARILALGGELSLSQTSKAIKALEEDLMVIRAGSSLTLRNPLSLLEELERGWRKPTHTRRQSLCLPPAIDWAAKLAEAPVKWAITGESSVTRYTAFSQGGPRTVAVSNLTAALQALNGEIETVRNFADLELLETSDEGYYFANEVDSNGARWASRLQTWLELRSGDARQRDAAASIGKQIVEELSK